MAKKYEVYHRGEWIDATFIKDDTIDAVKRIWIEYEHTEDDESGNPKAPYTRRILVVEDDVSLRITETE